MEQLLLLTLRIYATGSFLITIGDFSGMSTTSTHYIVHRVSAAIARLYPFTNYRRGDKKCSITIL